MAATSQLTSHASYLMPSLAHATVGDAMRPEILSCGPDATLREVAGIMAMNHVHCVAVIGFSHEEPECFVWSIASDLDLVRAAIGNNTEITARTLAREPLVTAQATMALRDASELMLREKVSHLVVIDPERDRPVGVISTLDIAGVLAWGEA